MEKDLCLRKRVYADAVSKTRAVRQKVEEAQAVLDEAEREEKERLSAYRVARAAVGSIKGPDMRVEIKVVVGGVTTMFVVDELTSVGMPTTHHIICGVRSVAQVDHVEVTVGDARCVVKREGEKWAYEKMFVFKKKADGRLNIFDGIFDLEEVVTRESAKFVVVVKMKFNKKKELVVFFKTELK
jgi:hypothetical protein